MTKNTIKAGDDIADHVGDLVAMRDIIDGVAQDLASAYDLLEAPRNMPRGLGVDIYGAFIDAMDATGEAVAKLNTLAAWVESYKNEKNEAREN